MSRERVLTTLQSTHDALGRYRKALRELMAVVHEDHAGTELPYVENTLRHLGEVLESAGRAMQ